MANDLRELANLPTLTNRIKELSGRYFISAKINKNPIIEQLREDYNKFRDRKKLNAEIPDINESLRNELLAFNTRVDSEFEKNPIILCSTPHFLKTNWTEQEQSQICSQQSEQRYKKTRSSRLFSTSLLSFVFLSSLFLYFTSNFMSCTLTYSLSYS